MDSLEFLDFMYYAYLGIGISRASAMQSIKAR